MRIARSGATTDVLCIRRPLVAALRHVPRTRPAIPAHDRSLRLLKSAFLFSLRLQYVAGEQQ